MEPNGWTVFFASFAGSMAAIFLFGLVSLLQKEKAKLRKDAE